MADDELRAMLDGEAEGAAWLTTPPSAIRYRPIAPGDHVTSARVVVKIRGGGLRSDLRAASSPGRGETTLIVVEERDWYANPASPDGQLDVPIEYVWVEERVPYPVDRLPPEHDPAYTEALIRLRQAPAEGSPWPLRLPTRAMRADQLLGRRVVVRAVTPERSWRDFRDHRAVSPITPRAELGAQIVRVLDEASWYGGWYPGASPKAVGLEPVCVWAE